MKLLIKFPTRGRPDIFKSTFSKYRDMLSGNDDYRFLISLDADDEKMNNPEIVQFLEEQKHLTYCYGNSRSKIQAINANMECAEEYDIILLASDDMIPLVHGYDQIIRDEMAAHFKDTFGVLHFNDGRTGRGLNTLSILGRKMYEHFGYIYHPQYSSLWCDNEFHEVTYAMKKVAYVDQVIIHHAWIDMTGQDELNCKNEKFYYSDQIVYEMRKVKGFPNENVPTVESSREYKLALAKARQGRRGRRR